LTFSGVCTCELSRAFCAPTSDAPLCAGEVLRLLAQNCGYAHRDERRFVVRADEKLTAFLELQSAIHEFAVSLIS
jgi:hypothetical protein